MIATKVNHTSNKLKSVNDILHSTRQLATKVLQTEHSLEQSMKFQRELDTQLVMHIEICTEPESNKNYNTIKNTFLHFSISQLG